MTLALYPARTVPATSWLDRVCPWIPAALLFYPLVLWPWLYGVKVDQLGPNGVVDETAGSALNQVYFVGAFALALACWWWGTRGTRLPLGRAEPALIALYLGWAAFTALWSFNADTTIRRAALQAIIVTTLFLSVAASPDLDSVLDRLFALMVVVTGLNIAYVLTHAPGPIGHEGLYPQKNGLGAVAAIVVLFALHRLLTGEGWKRLLALGVLAGAVLLLVLSQSKTSLLLAVAIPLLAATIAWASRYVRISAAVTLLATLGAGWLVFTVGEANALWTFGDIASALFGDPTITGRTDIWAYALRMADLNVWAGWGYQAFWDQGPESPGVRQAAGFVREMPHAHNGYIDMLLETGAVGLSLGVLLIVRAVHRAGALAGTRPGLAAHLLALMTFCALHNGLETNWFRGFTVLSMLFTLAVALSLRATDEDEP